MRRQDTCSMYRILLFGHKGQGSVLRASKMALAPGAADPNSCADAWSGIRVVRSEDGRGNSTEATRAFKQGEVLLQEPSLAMVYPSRDAPWLAAVRSTLKSENDACAWQYCVALHCLVEAELPIPHPPGIQPLPAVDRAKLEELCGWADDDDLEPCQLALDTAESLIVAAEAEAPRAVVRWPAGFMASKAYEEVAGDDYLLQRKQAVVWLARQLDDLAIRVSRNGFQIMDLKARPPTSADGLFHRISFFNHCCAGENNASWTWDGATQLLTVKAMRDVGFGEELTISYIAKPWSDLARAARRKYLKQNFNFVCLCNACSSPLSERGGQKRELDKKNGKLAGLLLKWMQDDGTRCEEQVEDDKVKLSSDIAGPATKPPPAPKVELTDAERLKRVLQRCAGEALAVSEEVAQAALSSEDGHIGKTMIRLRRQFRAAGDAGDLGVGTSSPPTIKAETSDRRAASENLHVSCWCSSALALSAAGAAVLLGLITWHRRSAF